MLLVPALPSVQKLCTSSLLEFAKCMSCVRNTVKLFLCIFKRDAGCKLDFLDKEMLKAVVVTYVTVFFVLQFY